MESAALDFSIGWRYPDTSLSDSMRWLRKFNKPNEDRCREINWVAEKLGELRKETMLSRMDLYILANLLGRESVTVSGCAKEALALAHNNQAEKVAAELLVVLRLFAMNRMQPRKRAALNAIEILASAGETNAIGEIAGLLAHFGRNERHAIARHMEELVVANPEKVDLAKLKRELQEQAMKLTKKGERGAGGELIGYLFRLRMRKNLACAENPKKAKYGKGKDAGEPIARIARIF